MYTYFMSLKDEATRRHLSDGRAGQKTKVVKEQGLNKQINTCMLGKLDSKCQSFKETNHTELNEELWVEQLKWYFLLNSSNLYLQLKQPNSTSILINLVDDEADIKSLKSLSKS